MTDQVLAEMEGTAPTRYFAAIASTHPERQIKMKTTEMVDKGLLQIGTTLTIKNRPGSEARVVDGNNVSYQNLTISFNEWAKLVLNTPASVYRHAVMPDGKTLNDLRNTYYQTKHSSATRSRETQTLVQHGTSKNPNKTNISSRSTRQNKMKIKEMVDSGILQIGTILTIRNRPGSEAKVVDGKHVRYRGKIITFMDWGRRVTGWSTLQIYAHATLSDGRLLDDLRK